VNDKVIPNFPTPSATVFGNPPATESKLKERQVIFKEKTSWNISDIKVGHEM
jgi:hypothetical protein